MKELEAGYEFTKAQLARLEQAEKLIAELEKAVEAVEINAEECLDLDDSMAMLVPIDDYHKLIEVLASAKAWKEGT